MDTLEYIKQINSIKPNPAHLDIIHGVCEDLGVTILNVKPDYIRLVKLGCYDMNVMTISLTFSIDRAWFIQRNIVEVYKRIIENFK